MSGENPSLGFPTRSVTNWAVQPQKMAGGLKSRIKKEEGLYYLCSENKGAELICFFVFANAKSRFSHDVAHTIMLQMLPNMFALQPNQCFIVSFKCVGNLKFWTDWTEQTVKPRSDCS